MGSLPPKRPTWAKLGDRTRQMLQRMNECVVLSEPDFIALVWPDGCSRQAHDDRIHYWLRNHFLNRVTLPERVAGFQIGPLGAKLLREAGFRSIAPTRMLSERTLLNIVNTNRFGMSLLHNVRHDPRVAGVAWINLASRHAGTADARSDGMAAIAYQLGHQPAERDREDGYLPELLRADYTPPPGIGLMRLVVEVDHGTESYQRLVERAQRWRATWDRTHWPPNTHALFVWVTTKGFERLNMIWQAWTTYALLPAVFSTEATLTIGDGVWWHPWHPTRALPDGRIIYVWHDSEGRPRSLRPWDGLESILRFTPPNAPPAPTLLDSIAIAYRQLGFLPTSATSTIPTHAHAA